LEYVKLIEMYRIIFATVGSRKPIWQVEIDDIEIVAGMLAAGMGIMDDLNAESKETYYIDSNTDVSEFRLEVDIDEEYLSSKSVNKLEEGEIGIWLKGSRRFVYSLYRFRTNGFFQGIISVCNTFGVDFRNYIYGFPFDRYGRQYSLGGYVMAPYQIGVDAPDIDDIEEEEEGNENIIEPLARTDDILTLKDEIKWMD